MSDDRLLLDTVFVQALLNRRNQYHRQALALLPRVRIAKEVWITDAVLIEVGNALSAVNRLGAVEFIRSCYQTSNMRVVPVDASLLDKSLLLYETRQDKSWSLTDCASFVVMDEQELIYAVTADEHFLQAGYQNPHG